MLQFSGSGGGTGAFEKMTAFNARCSVTVNSTHAHSLPRMPHLILVGTFGAISFCTYI
jgi:hypothetical protein